MYRKAVHQYSLEGNSNKLSYMAYESMVLWTLYESIKFANENNDRQTNFPIVDFFAFEP